MSDQNLVCVNPKCEYPNFVWTEGEQKFMQRLLEEGKIDTIIPPRRCPECRKKRKENKSRNQQ